MDRDRLTRVASRNFGLFTRADARNCGYSAYQIRRRIEVGDWQAVVGRTLTSAGRTITPALHDRAAQLSIPGSVLAGPSAARTWRALVPGDGTYLYVGRGGNSRITGVRLLFELPERRDVSLYQGLPVTSLPAAVVDCLRLLPVAAAVALLDRALQRGWLTFDDLVHRVQSRIGRPGAPHLVRLIRLARSGERSTLERQVSSLLTKRRITGWQANVPVYDGQGLIGVGDVVFERARLIIELDGWAFHATPERFQRDRRRQNRLVAAGWTVLRFTWQDATQRPDHLIKTIEGLLKDRDWPNSR